MKPLPIAAVGQVSVPATDPPEPLRPMLLAACPKAPRRLNRLIQLALIGAHRCVAGRALSTDTPVYVAFSHGSIADAQTLVRTTAAGRPPMPVSFINVSSNMAGFYIAGTLGLSSPNHVVAARDAGWEATLELAALGGARRERELIGAVEECAWPLDEHVERLHQKPGTSLLESSQWLLVDRSVAAPIATVEWIRRFRDDAALEASLLAEPWPADVQVGSDAGDEWLRARLPGRWPRWTDADPGYSGIRTAERCCRFIASGRGTLLHLSRTGTGACYGVRIRKS